MNCRKAKKLMPLYAGGDLSARRARPVGAHLASCPDCRRELEEYGGALETVRSEARAEAAPGWSDGEWQAVMAKAVGQAGPGPGRSRMSGAAVPRLRWAAAAGAAAAAVLAAVMLFRPDGGLDPGLVATAPESGEHWPGTAAEQDVVSVTLVSQESGLQVVWFFNRNFEWKGDQE